jgi:hypothetical protein
MNLTRSESRNTIGPSFKLQFDGVFNHLSTIEDEKKKITDQVNQNPNPNFQKKKIFFNLDFSCSISTSSTIKTNLSYICSIRY